MQKSLETTVLIVGGGPIGLACAIELAWRGIDCHVVERTDGPLRYSKMQLVGVRSMELCRRWGIAARVRQCGFPEDYPLNMVFCTSLNGHKLAVRPYPSMRDEPVPAASPEKKQRCPQMWFDPILAAAAKDTQLAKLHYHREFLSLEQTADKVVSRVRDMNAGEDITITSQYVIGCDGAGSSVRKWLDIPFEGDPVLSYSTGIYLRAPGLLQRHPMGPAERYLFVGPDGFWGNLTVVDVQSHWRLTIVGSREKVEDENFDAPAWVERAFGRSDIPYEIDAVIPWRRSRLVAGRYREGRVFLAGDAAHVMSPTGGYGMNTGLADVADLGWKIEAALSGWAGPGLLASYDSERRPVGWRNVNAAAHNFSNLSPGLDLSKVLEEGPDADAARWRIGHAFDESTRGEWEVNGVMLGYRYENSPIVVPDGTPEPSDDPIAYVQTARPGHRAPHHWIGGGRSTLDLFGRGFVLLRTGSAPPDPMPLVRAAAAQNLPLTVATLDDPALAALYEKSLALIRPDGHVAWRADAVPANPEAIVARVRGADQSPGRIPQ